MKVNKINWKIVVFITASIALSIFGVFNRHLFSSPSKPIPINLVKSWVYQIQGLEFSGAVEKLARLDVDMLVVEPMATMTDIGDFDAKKMVTRLKDSSSSDPKYRKLVLAYVDIGQAEEWRLYCKDDWRPPTTFGPAHPDFMIGEDPDGWAGNYPVAFWDTRWKGIIIYNETIDNESILNKILDLGFDGIYMDWVEAYDDEGIIKRAESDGKDPATEMLKFVGEIRKYARMRNADFLIVPQNAPYLIEDAGDYLNVIDGIAQEDLSFFGGGDTDWNDPESGDVKTPRDLCEWCRGDIARVLLLYKNAGKPVFTVDYSIKSKNVKEAKDYSLSMGFVPFVSRTPLDRIP